MAYRHKGKLHIGNIVINDVDGTTGQILTRDSDGVVKLTDASPLVSIATTLLTLNSTMDLQPINDFYGQTGLFELNTNGDLQPITGIVSDYTLELNVNNDIMNK